MMPKSNYFKEVKMKGGFILRGLGIVLVLVVLSALIPAGAALADDGDGGAEFVGIVQSLPATSGLIGDWQVGGKTVHVTNATRIKQEYGSVALGVTVEVKGTWQPDGSLIAFSVEVKNGSGWNPSSQKVKFIATVTTLPSTGWVGDWTVNGNVNGNAYTTVTVHVSTWTKISQEHGQITVGSFVKIEGLLQTDGSVNASDIEVVENRPTPGSTAEFYGRIEALPAAGLIGDWTVSNRVVHISATTRIEQKYGTVAIGAFVKIKGVTRADGTVDAQEIEVRANNPAPGPGPTPTPGNRYIKFYGVIQTLPAGGLIGDWTVSGIVVHVSNTTRIEQEYGAPMVNGRVEVKGTLRADGSVDAIKIETKRASTTTGIFGQAAAVTR